MYCLYGFVVLWEIEIYLLFIEGMLIFIKCWKEYVDLLYLSKYERGFVVLCKYNLIFKFIIKCWFYRV